MERDTGVAPVTSPWQGDELLLHQTRKKQQAQLTVKNLLAATTRNTQSLLYEDKMVGLTRLERANLLVRSEAL